MRLKNRRDKTVYEIPIVDVQPARIVEIQSELGERLFSDQPFETEEVGDLD